MSPKEAMNKTLNAIEGAIQNKIMPGDFVRHNITGGTYEVDKLYPGILRCKLPRPKVTSFGVAIRHCLINIDNVTKIENAKESLEVEKEPTISYNAGEDTTLPGGLS